MSCFTLTVRRGPSTDAGTFGTATLDSADGPGATFDWLELPWRDNKPDVSCIPYGTYRAVTVDSPHFGFKVYRLQFVPGRTEVEIHPANWAGDTTKGMYSDLRGCMAPGYGVGELQPEGYAPQKALLHSGDAHKDIMKLTGGAPISVKVIGFGQVGV